VNCSCLFVRFVNHNLNYCGFVVCAKIVIVGDIHLHLDKVPYGCALEEIG
jgi:hypothetical protein